MAMSSYGANLVAKFLTNQSTAGWPPSGNQVWLALCTSAPDSSYTGTTLDSIEPAAASYTRTSVPISGNWSTPSSGITQYNEVITLTPAGDWGLVTHWAFCDAQTNGNMILFGTLASAVNILSVGSQSTTIPAGYIRMIVA